MLYFTICPVNCEGSSATYHFTKHRKTRPVDYGQNVTLQRICFDFFSPILFVCLPVNFLIAGLIGENIHPYRISLKHGKLLWLKLLMIK